MSEVATGRDITHEVGEFFDKYNTERKEVAVHIPGLLVFARDGLIRASVEVQDGDCRGPYTWTRTEEAGSFKVNSISTSGYYSPRAYLGTLDTDKIPVTVTRDNLENMRFVVDEAEVKTIEDQILPGSEVYERLAHGPQGVDIDIEGLVGYENELKVSVRDGLRLPLTIPPYSEHGHPRPVHMASVRGLSVIGSEQNRCFMLQVHHGRYGNVGDLPPVSFDDVIFSVEPREIRTDDLPSLILHRMAKGDMPGVHSLVEQFNARIVEDRANPDARAVGFRPSVSRARDPAGDSHHYVVMADYSDDCVGELSSKAYSHWDALNAKFTADKIVFSDEEPFIVDEEKDIAMSLKHADVGSWIL